MATALSSATSNLLTNMALVFILALVICLMPMTIDIVRHQLKLRQQKRCAEGKHEETIFESEFRNGSWAVEDFYAICKHCGNRRKTGSQINYD